jgi:membrane-associated protease RseP (regulator of RpoE activity)
MAIGIGLAVMVGLVVVAELGRALVAKVFGYPPERHAIPIMKLPGIRGTTGFRLTLILAGPVTAYLAVAILAFGFFRCTGTPTTDGANEITATLDGFEATRRLAAGDVVLEVDGAPFSGGAATLSQLVNAKHGAPIALTIERAGAKQIVSVAPAKHESGWRLGMVLASKREYSTTKSLGRAIVYPAEQAAATFKSLIEIFKGREEPEAGGPVRIVAEFRRAFDASLAEQIVGIAMICGTWATMLIALFDLVRALLLILFRS